MRLLTSGLHHVTAIARNAHKTAAFYGDVLGMRVVKQTVNFDDTNTYHLYFGDPEGRPGTLLTFFVRPDADTGRAGSGQAVSVRFAVPAGSLSSWSARLARRGVRFTEDDRFECGALTCADPDGLDVQLVATGAAEDPGSAQYRDVPVGCSIRGLHSIGLAIADAGPTAALLTHELGFVETLGNGGRRRFRAAGEGPGLFVDLLAGPATLPGSMGVGCVHHVAFRARDPREQLAWQHQLRTAGLDATDVRDRKYFRSIYFNEPGGVRFEIATDTPGFAVDESPRDLGSRLQLPLSLESQRERLEAGLGVLPV